MEEEPELPVATMFTVVYPALPHPADVERVFTHATAPLHDRTTGTCTMRSPGKVDVMPINARHCSALAELAGALPIGDTIECDYNFRSESGLAVTAHGHVTRGEHGYIADCPIVILDVE